MVYLLEYAMMPKYVDVKPLPVKIAERLYGKYEIRIPAEVSVGGHQM